MLMARYRHVRLLLPAGSLQLLEQQVVGGEQAKNKDLKEKHKRRKRYADERKKQLVAALQTSDEDGGDWVLLRVYDSIQEEVRAKSKLLEKMQRKVRPPPRPGGPDSAPGIYPAPAVCLGRPGGSPGDRRTRLLCWESVCDPWDNRETRGTAPDSDSEGVLGEGGEVGQTSGFEAHGQEG